MRRSIYRAADGTLKRDLPLEELVTILASGRGTVWIDWRYDPSEREELHHLLCERLRFHPLSVDDALKESHSPRVDDWAEYLYVVLHALDRQSKGELRTKELDVFLGAHYLITLHDEPMSAVDRVLELCARSPLRWMTAGPDHILYAVTDHVVAAYVAAVEGLEDDLDEIEAEIFQRRPEPTVPNRLFRIRRALSQLRRVLGPHREVFTRLSRDHYGVIDEYDRVFFRDVLDHVARLHDTVDTLREMGASALESYMTVTSTRINQIMRTLTVVSVLFMPLSFISSFFGMNFFGEAFALKPARVWKSGLFWGCMATMLLLPPGMLLWMWWQGWLKSENVDVAHLPESQEPLIEVPKELVVEPVPVLDPPDAEPMTGPVRIAPSVASGARKR